MTGGVRKKFEEINKKILKPRVDNTVIIIRNSHVGNWATRGVIKKFIVGGIFKWCIHKFNWIDPDKAIEILAESERGPSVVLRIIGEK